MAASSERETYNILFCELYSFEMGYKMVFILLFRTVCQTNEQQQQQ